MAQYELSLQDYIRVFRKRKTLIFLVFLFVFLLSFLYSKKEEEPIYQATTIVKVESRRTIAGLLTESIIYNPGDIMASETKLIKSFPVMKEAALKLGMCSKDSPQQKINEAVINLQSMVETELVGNTNMIKIIATSKDPYQAMEISNTVAQAYINYNLFEKARQAKQEKEFIEEQLGILETKLKEIEDKVKGFNEDVKDIKLVEPLQAKLVELEFKLSGLLQKYTEKHPQVIELKEQIQQLESQLKGLSAQQLEYARLEREAEVNKKLYAMLKEKLEEARISESQKVPDVSIVNPAIMPEAPIKPSKKINILIGAFLGFILGLVLAFIFETVDTSLGTIEEIEKTTKLLVLGVIPSINFKKISKRKFLFSSIFFHKKISGKDKRIICLFSHFYPSSNIAEAFRNIYTNLKLEKTRRVILVTSSIPFEGKSFVVSNLAIVMAQAGLKTLLINADLRRPIISKVFGINPYPGFSELIRQSVSLDEALRNIVDIFLGQISFDQILQQPQLDNLWILPEGRFLPNPIEVLVESEKIKSVLENLKEQFDAIVIDSPPVLSVSDTNLLASISDSVVLVYESGRTSREALNRARSQLETSKANIIGVVLNHTRPQTENLETYPFHYYRNVYYKD
ncbi:MAG: AAA family ATPase [Candidatus Omnitrophica bacterium]|nr:AAA family ATPase [Candidatus Omnitrophota bacterium]